MSEARIDETREGNDPPPSILVFDVNETLVDIEAMRPLYERVLGSGRALREWFGQLVLNSMTTKLSGLREDFFSLGLGLFEMHAPVARHVTTATTSILRGQARLDRLTSDAARSYSEGLSSTG
jgi:2-haloacid dehalogenase